MIVWRVMAVAAGMTAAGYGVILLFTALSIGQLAALTVWLAAVVVVHDAVWAPTISWLRARWYRDPSTRPFALTATVHVGFVVGGILTLFVVPEIWAQSRGNPNPTILVGDYATRLLGVWAVIALTVLVVARVLTRRSRRRPQR